MFRWPTEYVGLFVRLIARASIERTCTGLDVLHSIQPSCRRFFASLDRDTVVAIGRHGHEQTSRI
jgi:hypothetical protein